MGFLWNVDPRRIRVHAKETYDGKLFKNIDGSLNVVLERFQKLITSVYVEILDFPEDLKKGDRLMNVRYYNTNHEFITQYEIPIHKSLTMRDLKTKLKEKTGTPEENQGWKFLFLI